MRFKKTLLYAMIVSAFFACSAIASENRISYSLSLVGMSMDYKEHSSGGVLLDSEDSNLGDISGYEMSLGYIFSRYARNQDEIGISLMQLAGKSTYKGSVLGSGDPYGSLISTTSNSFIDTSIDYRHTYFYKRYLSFVYGIGFGYHAWERKLSSVQKELYEWYSFRPMLGVDVKYKKMQAGISAEYQYGFHTRMHSSNPSLGFILGGADIFEVAVPVTYNYRDNMAFFIKTVFSKQTIGKSDYVSSGGNTYYEPSSTSNDVYVKLGAVFKF
ncbi:hypothetical protein [Sulfurimonas sp. HSL-1716]|uniref:hypothetical protein n=1 Tax=Hydrocurvibacter sulfurireducens TaxID=3131937 RepID=UPI0031F77727